MRALISRGGVFAALVLLASCGGGGGGSGGSSGGGTGTPAPPVRTLFVFTQPAGATAGATLTTQPVVRVLSDGAIATTDNTTIVTASIVANTGTAGATLSGTTTATAVAGVATFTNLGLSVAGSGYQLRFGITGGITVDSDAFNVAAAPPVVNDVTFTIDSSQDVHAISRFIYGVNGWDGVRPANLALSRSGGNRMTAYNWENNASNAGSDYFNENDAFLGGGNTPNGAVAPSIATARGAGAGIVVTMPTIGHVSADKSSADKEDVNVTPNYIDVRFKVSRARKGSAFTLTPDTSDGFVYQDEYINLLNQTYPGAFASTTSPIFIDLDNEVDLWAFTHARLRGDATSPVASQAGNKITYAEVVQLSTDYSKAAKDVNAAVQIFGPVSYGWNGYVSLQDAPDAGGRDFLGFYLAQMAAASAADNRRLLDALDLHWYPEATGGGVRITNNDNSAAVVAARVAAPRSLWDSTYRETSWIQQSLGNGQGINLLPRIRDKIAANYPGTKLALTEYNYGGANHISGAIAQADVLGIFGREGVFAATMWPLETNNNFIFGGFEAFRDYDGMHGSFGDTSIRATSSDIAATSVYASVDAGSANRMVIVAINKTATPKVAGIAVTHTAQFHAAQIYAVTAASALGKPVRQADIAITQPNSFQYTMPANSVTTLVLMP